MKKIALCLLAFFLVTGTVHADPYATLATGGKGGWLNTTRALTADDFKGRAVLLDFWTYGCINCMQIIPDLESLEQEFGNKLLIVGVHSAKFQGEQGNERIEFAIKRFGLKHPVINDSDFVIWNSYDVKAWPTQILLDPDGKEIARYSGEGHKDEIAKDIESLSINSDLAAAPVVKAEDKTVLLFPSRMIVYGQNFAIADMGHNRILVTDKGGKILYKIGAGTKGLKDGNLSTAQFNAPRGIAAIDDKVYVADTGNHALREIDLKAKTVATLAGNGIRGQRDHLASPWDVADDNDGNIVIANAGTHQLLSYDLKDKKLSTLAGTGREDIKDGAALEADLAQPSAISIVDKTIYFVDAESSALRMLKDGKVQTLIGTGLFDFGLKDGKYPEARLQHPQGLSASAEKIYIADTYNNAIRVYDLKSEALSSLTLEEKLNEPGSISVAGDMAYIVDTNDNTIRQIDLKTGKAGDFSIQP